MVQFRLPMLPNSGEVDWNAKVNGVEYSIPIESNAILLDVLRDQAGSLGTKRGCDMGTCGCCSVLVDGEPRLSCLTLASEAKGSKITTVEGLADGHHLHRRPRARQGLLQAPPREREGEVLRLRAVVHLVADHLHTDVRERTCRRGLPMSLGLLFR